MSITFSNQVFKKSSNIKNSSDYLQNKKANLLLNNLNTDIENKKFGNQSNYLLIEKAIIINNINNIDKSNKNDILSDLYSHVHLGSSLNDYDSNLQDNEDDFNDDDDDDNFLNNNNNNIKPIVSNSNSNITTIDNKTIYPNKKNVPFYYKYRIDPNGNLFGNTPSENNYNKFRFITK